MSFSESPVAEHGAGVRKQEGLGNFDRGLSNSGAMPQRQRRLSSEASGRSADRHDCAGVEFDSPLSKFSRPSCLHAPATGCRRAISEKLIFQFEFLFHHTSKRVELHGFMPARAGARSRIAVQSSSN